MNKTYATTSTVTVDKKVSELTVSELKLIIREIVREEIAMQRINTPFVPAVPLQPYYNREIQPNRPNEVWCGTRTEEK